MSCGQKNPLNSDTDHCSPLFIIQHPKFWIMCYIQAMLTCHWASRKQTMFSYKCTHVVQIRIQVSHLEAVTLLVVFVSRLLSISFTLIFTTLVCIFANCLLLPKCVIVSDSRHEQKTSASGMELVSLPWNGDFTPISPYGVSWYQCTIKAQWWQIHSIDAKWVSRSTHISWSWRQNFIQLYTGCIHSPISSLWSTVSRIHLVNRGCCKDGQIKSMCWFILTCVSIKNAIVDSLCGVGVIIYCIKSFDRICPHKNEFVSFTQMALGVPVIRFEFMWFYNSGLLQYLTFFITLLHYIKWWWSSHCDPLWIPVDVQVYCMISGCYHMWPCNDVLSMTSRYHILSIVLLIV